MATDRKRHAQALKSNPLLAEILNDRESDCIEKWRNAYSTLYERERVWNELKAIEELREFIESQLAAILAGDGDPDGSTSGDAGATV
jgi:hypothetical protein